MGGKVSYRRYFFGLTAVAVLGLAGTWGATNLKQAKEVIATLSGVPDDGTCRAMLTEEGDWVDVKKTKIIGRTVIRYDSDGCFDIEMRDEGAGGEITASACGVWRLEEGCIHYNVGESSDEDKIRCGPFKEKIDFMSRRVFTGNLGEVTDAVVLRLSRLAGKGGPGDAPRPVERARLPR